MNSIVGGRLADDEAQFVSPGSQLLASLDDELFVVDPEARHAWALDGGVATAERLPAEASVTHATPFPEDSHPVAIGDSVFFFLTRDIVAAVVQTRLPGAGFVLRSAAVQGRDALVLGFADLTERHGGVLCCIDHRGRVISRVSPGAKLLMDPASVRVSAGGTILVTDGQLHTVTEYTLAGLPLWSFGKAGAPGSARSRLRSPSDAIFAAGRVVIADTLNNRVLIVSEGLVRHAVALPYPSTLTRWNESTVALIGGMGHAAQITASGRVGAVWGGRQEASELSRPRSIAPVKRRRWLVADTNHHRLVDVGQDGSFRELSVQAEVGDFDWPRSARPTSDGGCVVADGLNGRVIGISASGSCAFELTRLRTRREYVDLEDPHDAVPIGDELLLVVDSGAHFIALCNREGALLWSCGAPADPHCGAMRDPHQALPVDGNGYLVVDSLNDRVVHVDRAHNLHEILLSDSAGRRVALTYPRALASVTDGWVISDSQLGLISVDSRWRVTETSGRSLLSAEGSVILRAPPRGLAAQADGTIGVTDFAGDRILFLNQSRTIQ